jgi:diaminopimelate decarboxylase
LDGQAIHAAGVIATMPAVNLEGIHCHLGSQITSSSLFLRALDVVFDFAKKARAIAPIKKINVGGGFATPGIDRQRIGPLQNLLSVFGLALPPQQSDSFCLNHLLGGIKDLIHQYDLADLQFFVEPGRLVVSDTMSLLTRVSAVKATGGLQWAIIDAGTNMAPGISPGEFHNITCVRQTDAPLTAFRVAGPLCYEADIISNSHLLPGDLHEGDYLLISDSGAYSISRATNFIRCRPPVVSWDGQTTNLCWRRESFDDVFRFSTLEVTD